MAVWESTISGATTYMHCKVVYFPSLAEISRMRKLVEFRERFLASSKGDPADRNTGCWRREEAVTSWDEGA